MTEPPENVVRKYLKKLIGKRVSSARLALNSLVLDVEVELRQPQELYLWVEPTWHIRRDNGVVLGSRQSQIEDEEARNKLNKLAAELNGLVIEDAELDGVSHDIELRFSGGYALRTFVTDPADEEIWYIRDNTAKLAAGANPSTYFVSPVHQFIPPDQK